MHKLARFGVSMDNEFLKEFDNLITTIGYNTRSEAIRDLIREKMAERKIKNRNTTVFGILTFVYDHHKREIQKTLNNIQHHHFKNIVFTTHVHVDHHNCLEIIVIKDKAGNIQNFAKIVLSLKGVKHGKLNLITSEKIL